MSEPELAVKPNGGAPPEPTKPKSLGRKICEIQNLVGMVKKKGKNQDQGWEYLRIEDAVVAVNKLMAERGLILTPSLQKKPSGEFDIARVTHTKGYIMDLVFAWTLEDTETGEARSYDIPGSGWDYNDKGKIGRAHV